MKNPLFRFKTICSLSFMAALLLSIPVQSIASEIDRIVAIVNEDIITKTELAKELSVIKQQSQMRLPSDDILNKQVLERLILKRIQQQLADINNITIDDETLNNTLLGIAKQNNMSLSEFHDALSRDGMDFEYFRENIRNEIVLRKLRQRFVDNQVTISEQEIDNAMANQKTQGRSGDEYQIGHILISIPEAASARQIADAEQRASNIQKDLLSGEDFSQSAIKNSDGQQALQGGDLGWRKISELPSLFTNVILKMENNELSELIRSPSGFHIIKLLDHRSGERHVIAQTKIRHILIKPDELLDEEQAHQKLLEIRSRVVDGEDFSTLAREFSADKGSAANGGDLGWASPGEMVPVFEKAMDTLAINELSDAVKSQFGWHLMQVQARRNHDDTERFNRDKARQLIYQQKIEESYTAWLRRLRSEAYIKNMLNPQG